MEEILESHESYVHIGNSGFTFTAEVKDLDREHGGTQWLTIQSHMFGIPHSSSFWLDENTLDALEYVLEKARLQRTVYKMTSYDATHKPQHDGAAPEDDRVDCSDSDEATPVTVEVASK